MLKVSFFKRLTFKQIKKAENLNIKFISKHKESPVTLGFELYQYLSTNMVEARGIEPLSEKHLHKLSTSVSDD